MEAYQNLSLAAVCVQASTSERHHSAALQTEGSTTTKAGGQLSAPHKKTKLTGDRSWTSKQTRVCVHHSFLTAWPGNDVKPGTEGSREAEAPSSRPSFTLIPFQSHLQQTYFLWFTKGSQFVLPWLRWTWSCAKPCHASLVWITYPSNDSQKVLMWFSHSPFKGDNNHRIISKWLAENG